MLSRQQDVLGTAREITLLLLFCVAVIPYLAIFLLSTIQ